MPDYNPDREGHVPHKFVVINADLQPRDGVQTSRGFLKFGHGERLMVKDESLAREIQQQYGRDLTVTRVRTPEKMEKSHRYHFGQWPEMPWKRKKEKEQDDGTSKDITE